MMRIIEAPPADWELVEFGSVLNGGTRTGIYKQKQFHGSGIKMINMGELFANPKLKSVPMERIQLSEDEKNRFDIQVGDLIFARRSLVASGAGKCAIVCEVLEPTTFESSIIRARPKPEIADSQYLFYLFNSPLGKHLLDTILRQVAVSGITGSDLVKLKIPLPPLPIQHTIARILGSLDEKIELNRQMNETLEAMARAIFKSWFVDFDPVRAKAEGRQPTGMDAETAALFPDSFEVVDGREVPKGWKVATLGDYIEVIKGLSYKGEGLCDDGIPMHNLNSVLEGGGYKYPGIKFYKGEFQERHIILPGDIIVTNTEQGFDFLLIGYPAIVPKFYGDSGLFTHHLFRVRPLEKSQLTNHFIYYLLMAPAVREQVIGCTNGTTVNMMYRDGLTTPQFILPSIELINRFEEIAVPMFEIMENNEQQSRTLAQIRDTLLPKLMKGELQLQI